ncbi:thiamine-phosphate kinase [Vibrio sp. RC27]
MSGEFSLINRYFIKKQSERKDVHLDIGDDCAIVKVPENSRLAITTDTMVAGTHFLPDANPKWIAHKALASNISDLAAMGARPAWCSLAISLPDIDDAWLESFSAAFFELADYYNVKLIGGDTTKGPLSITLTLHGFLPNDYALTRHNAKAGDWIYVTGTLGDSKAGLDVILDNALRSQPSSDVLEQRHYLSTPRVLLGQALLNVASCAIDISDGLVSDIQHILTSSNVGATLNVEHLPISDELVGFLNNDRDKALQYALTSGEEYELCFIVSPYNIEALESHLSHCNTPYQCIGQIRGKEGLELHSDGQALTWQLSGFDHFGISV